MLNTLRMKGSKVLIWVLFVPLIVGLAGFGISDMLRGGFSTTVASVGDRDISADDYVREMQREMARQGQMFGQNFNITQARAFGIDKFVLRSLTRRAATEAEAERVGLSVSDAAVAEEIAAIPAFQGADGRFSIEQARLALQQNRITESELRDMIRGRATGEMINRALAAQARMPQSYYTAILSWTDEKRGFAMVRLDAEKFGGTPPERTDEERAAWHKANEAEYTLPETRVAAYALLDPAAIAAAMEIGDEDLRKEYDARIASFRTPERRSVQRLAFGTAEEAEAAKARIAAGETTLAKLAEERGLAPADIEMGEIAADALPEAARAAVFALAEPGLAGPAESPFGPALYQVNAILAATETPFETAKAGIRDTLAKSRARDEAVKKAAQVEDLVAEGAKVEDIVKEAGLLPGTVEIPATGPAEGLAADENVRAKALAAAKGTETDMIQTADGRFVVLRVDEIRPSRLQDVAEVKDRIDAALALDAKRDATRAAAEALAAKVNAGEPLASAAAALGLTPSDVAPLTRDKTADGVPTELVTAVFEAPANGAVLANDATGTIVAQVGQILSFDPAGAEAQLRLARAQAEIDAGLISDIFDSWGAAVEARDKITVNGAAVEAALSRIQ